MTVLPALLFKKELSLLKDVKGAQLAERQTYCLPATNFQRKQCLSTTLSSRFEDR